jgi:hypothetical protein
MIEFDRYKCINELMREIETGLDIEFEYHGKRYAITPLADGYSIAEAYREDETEQVFETGKELVETYRINGAVLRDIATEIDVVAH